MSESTKGCVVSFEKDFDAEQCEVILNAIRMIRGVADAEASVVDIHDWHARIRVRIELANALAEFASKILNTERKHD